METNTPCIALAGATGGLGLLVAEELRRRGAAVKALVRPQTAGAKVRALTALGVEVAEVDLGDVAAVTAALRGASCMVSTLNGLAPVILGAQGVLLDAAVAAGVPRFIPSDFSLDFTKTAPGSNRNLDLRRRFHERLAASPIAWTSVLNGAFMDMLDGQMPMVIDKIHRVVHVGDADQTLDFTTMRDTAGLHRRGRARRGRHAADPAHRQRRGQRPRARRRGEPRQGHALQDLARRWRRPAARRDRHRQEIWRRGPGVPSLAGHAVHGQHVLRRRQARATRQRSLSRPALDQGRRGVGGQGRAGWLKAARDPSRRADAAGGCRQALMTGRSHWIRQ